MMMRLKVASLVAAAAVTTTLAGVAQGQSTTPIFGQISISDGFQPDPYNVVLRAGGPLDASGFNSACDFYATDMPSYHVNYVGQGTMPLVFSADSSEDTTLLIRAPDGRIYCDDDGGLNGDNPAVYFQNPPRGLYEVWVGNFWNSNLTPAVLSVSQHSSN